jgi:hypothetical protein
MGNYYVVTTDLFLSLAYLRMILVHINERWMEIEEMFW